MNIFRIAGDGLHMSAFVFLLVKIWWDKSCKGISGKTQLLFALVNATRYVDLLTVYISIYNTSFKAAYIVLSVLTIYSMFVHHSESYDWKGDSFPIKYLLVPCGVAALFFNYELTDVEVLWTFSIYLEVVAILPQLYLIIKTGICDKGTLSYLLMLGSYRCFYLINWVYRYLIENHYDLISDCSGTFQTLIYCVFFCLYISIGVGNRQGDDEDKLLTVSDWAKKHESDAQWNEKHYVPAERGECKQTKYQRLQTLLYKSNEPIAQPRLPLDGIMKANESSGNLTRSVQTLIEKLKPFNKG